LLKSKSKVKERPRFLPQRPTRNVGLTKKEFVTKVVGLETHTTC
jgi:hypothetical protein